MRGSHAESYSDISPQTILSKFKTPYFFLNILLRCCLCNSSFIWAKVRSGQRCSFSANLNLLYHLLLFILPHNCCIVMVVLYVGAIVLVVGGYIQYERVTRIEEGQGFIPVSLLTAVSTHEEHHFPVYNEGVGHIQVISLPVASPRASLRWSKSNPSTIWLASA